MVASLMEFSIQLKNKMVAIELNKHLSTLSFNESLVNNKSGYFMIDFLLCYILLRIRLDVLLCKS